MPQSHPDADLHPHATGHALLTTHVHQDPTELTLYSGWFCPFVQRVWIALEEKGLPYTYVEVNPYHKPDSLLRLNPRGLVPTLEFEGKPLYESTVLLEFLEDAFPDAPRLRPQGAFDRAYARIWTDFVTSRMVPSFHRFLQCQGDEAELTSKRQEFLGYLKEFARAMDEKGPFFMGAKFGTVDVIMAPWAVRLWVFDEFKGGLGIPEEGKGGEDESFWRRWRSWYAAVEKRRSIVETLSERKHYLPIYQRYARDEAQSELAKATREGRGVP